MNYKKQLLTTCAIIFFGLMVNAQNSVNSSGGDATGNGGTISYSIGQLNYQTYTGINGSVSQGVQQPYEISVVTSVESIKGLSLSVSAFPNPTTDFLTLSIDNNIQNTNATNLLYKLYNIQGKLLQGGKLIGDKTQIDMSSYAKSSYFIKIQKDGDSTQKLKIFKIIKN